MAKNLLKQERRRRMNESRAALITGQEESQQDPAGNRLWEQIEPHFHDALDRLKPADREAILLRFVQEQSLGEVGAALGISENTARMRIQRALERIRTHLAKVGVVVTLAALTGLLEQRAAQAAPADLIARVSRVASGDTPLNASLSEAVAHTGRVISRPAGRKPLLALLVSLCLLGGLLVYRQSLPHRLGAAAQRRLFMRMAGNWRGDLEFADDRTHQRATYPTTVVCSVESGGSGLRFTSAFTGSHAVDVMTLMRDPRSGTVTVRNGGPKSTHLLAAVGEFVAAGNGNVHFEGFDLSRNVETHLAISVDRSRLTAQEEYRFPGGAAFHFRNRYTLTRQ
jgi:hypothetical protein